MEGGGEIQGTNEEGGKKGNLYTWPHILTRKKETMSKKVRLWVVLGEGGQQKRGLGFLSKPGGEVNESRKRALKSKSRKVRENMDSRSEWN